MWFIPMLPNVYHLLYCFYQIMRAKIPKLIRNAFDGSITLTYQQPKCSLIWLHGLGDQPDSYLPYFAHLLSPLYHGCRIRLLSAPNRLLSATQAHSPAWYEPHEKQADANQVNNSNSILHKYFTEEMAFWSETNQGKIPAQHRVYVGGMGQGASMALHYSYSAQDAPAGVIALSGSLLPQTELKNLRKMPALIMHGRMDESIREIQARRSLKEVLKDEYLVQYKVYDDLAHGVNLQQLEKMREWLEESHEFIRKHYQSAQPV